MHFPDCFGDVFGFQAAGQENGFVDGVTDAAADGPIMCAARAAQFFYRESLVAGIEQERVNLPGNGLSFINGFFPP